MRTHRPAAAIVLFWVAVVVAVLGAGCATANRNHDSDLPWNTPQQWEGGLSIPGFNER